MAVERGKIVEHQSRIPLHLLRDKEGKHLTVTLHELLGTTGDVSENVSLLRFSKEKGGEIWLRIASQKKADHFPICCLQIHPPQMVDNILYELGYRCSNVCSDFASLSSSHHYSCSRDALTQQTRRTHKVLPQPAIDTEELRWALECDSSAETRLEPWRLYLSVRRWAPHVYSVPYTRARMPMQMLGSDSDLFQKVNSLCVLFLVCCCVLSWSILFRSD